MTHSQRKKTPESLHRNFWEIAQKPESFCRTPFAEMRTQKNLEKGDVAALMGWEYSDYAELDYGDMRASPETILTFCRAMKCHPLDLYCPEAGPGMPLPREILYSLIAMVEKPGFSHNDRARSLYRLDREYRSARAMVRENTDDLQPLMLAMGYSPDGQSYRAPLYDDSEDDAEAEGRTLIDASLLESRMLLEEMCDTYKMIYDRRFSEIIKNARIMENKAVVLFGEKNALPAIAELKLLLGQWDDPNALSRAFRKCTDIVAPLIQVGEDINRSQILGDKRVFFQSVQRHLRYTREHEMMSGSVQTSEAALENFLRWQDNPKTRILIDWYESCVVLQEIAEEHPHSKTLRPGPQPAQG
ncbi:MAG: hypothetical protein JWO78_1825 [Micavibrio sp.]|nr:hypothetical protein [Micavibrio sp.]